MNTDIDLRNIKLETQRLILRPWKRNKADAKDLFLYASDPRIGPAAGWPVHATIEDSKRVIRDVLSTPGLFAVVLKETGRVIGCAGVTFGATGRKFLKADEGEIGYWIGYPCWNKGYASEALREMCRFCFEQLGMRMLWCGWYEGNERSRRVQEKCGFVYDHTDPPALCEPLHEIRTEHFMKIKNPGLEKAGHAGKDGK